MIEAFRGMMLTRMDRDGITISGVTRPGMSE